MKGRPVMLPVTFLADSTIPGRPQNSHLLPSGLPPEMVRLLTCLLTRFRSKWVKMGHKQVKPVECSASKNPLKQGVFQSG
jgi:hypothetical protein